MPGQSKTQVEVTQRIGERRQRENCLHGCSAGEGRGGNGQDSSARGDTEEKLAPAHLLRTVKESQTQRWTFILVLCSLFFISRKLRFVRLKLLEDSRVPGLLMPLPNARQQ